MSWIISGVSNSLSIFNGLLVYAEWGEKNMALINRYNTNIHPNI